MMNKTKQIITRIYHQKKKKKKKKKKSKVPFINKWKHSDLPVFGDFEWNLPITALDSHEPPSSLFEEFLKDDILQFIGNESVRYTQNRGYHSYMYELQDLKPLLQFFSSVDMLIYPKVLCFGNVQLMSTMMLFLQ